MACITLLSDFGLQDASAAVAKGILMQYNSTLPVFDISHEVMPFNTRQAAYLLAAASNNFPNGTLHVILFDLFSEPPHQLVLSEQKGSYFLSADNGVVPLALGDEPIRSWRYTELEETSTFIDWLHAAGQLVADLPANDALTSGLQTYQLRNSPPGYQPAPGGNVINCNVIHIDNYENVVVEFTRKQLETLGQGRQVRIEFGGMEEVAGLSSNYNDVRPGFKLCRFNSSGYLEICINRGKAASLFGLRLGGKQNDIKIIFE